jgi:SOS response regulatory protein OraA/RecX
VAVVTALRERPRGRIEIELDGSPWRLVPIDAVVRSGIAVGRPLDRETARSLGRELRRAQALGTALRALGHRELSRRRLEERLERRGARADARSEALDALEHAGLVDDARFAATRAGSLAARGYGDEAIRVALEREGVGPEQAAEALADLEPEAERVERLMQRRSADARTARWLAARGFAAETVEDALTGFAESD